MTGEHETWNDRFGPEEAEHRLEILVRGTGAQFWSYVLASATPERAEQLRPRLEQVYADDPETLELVREIVNRKSAGAIWGPAVSRLRRRGELLERRAYRDPRKCAARLVGLWGGRRWRGFR